MKRKSMMTTGLMCLAVYLVAVDSLLAQNAIVNPGFEAAGASPSLAASWTTDTAAGGPVYAVRTNDNPHSGSFNYEAYLASVGGGPVVEFKQSGIPAISGASYTFSFYSDRLTNSTSDNEQYNIQWFGTNSALVGQSGYTTFTPGAGVYAQTTISNLVAPATAATAAVLFHAAGGANPAWTATVDYDDISLATTNTVSGGGGGGGPTTNNQFQVSIVPAVGISWFASNNITYQVQWASDNVNWTNLGGQVSGNGTTNTVLDSPGPPHNFYQVISIQ